MSSEFKSLSIAELAKQEAYVDVWVMNTSSGANRGIVLFSVNTSSGKEENVLVHASAAPFCLTDHVTKAQLLESSTFRRALTSRLLTMIHKDEAEAILEEPGMLEEQQRVRRLTIGAALDDAQNGMGREEPEVVVNENVSVPVQQYIDMLDIEDSKDDQALMQLRNMGALTLEEYRAVLKKCKAIKFEATGRYAASRIAAINK